MKVGIPSEVKNREYRVALTPAGVHQLVGSGPPGRSSRPAPGWAPRSPTSSTSPPGPRSSPTPPRCGGARTSSARSRSPWPSEYGYLRDDLVLFTYLHLAADRPATDALLAAGHHVDRLRDRPAARRLAAAAGADERGRRSAVHPGRRVPPDEERGRRRGPARRRARRRRRARSSCSAAGSSGGTRPRSPSACARTSRCSTCRCRGLRETDSVFGGRVRTIASSAYAIEREAARRRPRHRRRPGDRGAGAAGSSPTSSSRA